MGQNKVVQRSGDGLATADPTEGLISRANVQGNVI